MEMRTSARRSGLGSSRERGRSSNEKFFNLCVGGGRRGEGGWEGGGGKREREICVLT